MNRLPPKLPPRLLRCLPLAVSLALIAHTVQAVTVQIDFEELPVGPQSFYNGSDGAGGFETRSSWFNNQNSGFWSGWSYSQTTDTTTPGVLNQYSAFTGSGVDGSATYAVAYNGLDAGNGGLIPEITLPAGAEPQRVQVTNTTYAVLSMLSGDSFAKKFGGVTGNDPDYFLLTVEGLDGNDELIDPNAVIEFYLADYRFANNGFDYILDEWTELDLTPLAGLGVEKLAFRFESSDNSIFGMNTPAYVAIDNLELDIAATPGDFDLNGTVNSLDLAIWESNYGNSSMVSFTDGDADENGVVDAQDFLLWQRNVTPPIGLVVAVPEPSTLAVAITFVLFTHLAHDRFRSLSPLWGEVRRGASATEVSPSPNPSLTREGDLIPR